MKAELFAIIKKKSKLWRVHGVEKSYQQTEMKTWSDLL